MLKRGPICLGLLGLGTECEGIDLCPITYGSHSVLSGSTNVVRVQASLAVGGIAQQHARGADRGEAECATAALRTLATLATCLATCLATLTLAADLLVRQSRHGISRARVTHTSSLPNSGIQTTHHSRACHACGKHRHADAADRGSATVLTCVILEKITALGLGHLACPVTCQGVGQRSLAAIHTPAASCPVPAAMPVAPLTATLACPVFPGLHLVCHFLLPL